MRAGARIAIVLPDLRPGGVERMRLHLAREWVRQGYTVDVVLLRRVGELLEQVPPGVRVVSLDAPRFRSSVVAMYRYLRKERPAVLLAAMWPMTSMAGIIALCARAGIRTVVSEHAVLSSSYPDRGRVHRMLMRATTGLGYRLADARIAVSRGVAYDAGCLASLAVERFQVIHNPATTGVDGSGHPPVEYEGAERPIILSVGSLKAVKDHRSLIEAFARFAATHAGSLFILGEGVLRPELEALVERLNLRGRVHLPGFRMNTAPWYAHADLFVLSSKHEGFGNVLVESLEQGTPVVSTDCPAGPREILDDGKFGKLVPTGDITALATGIADALAAPADRVALKARAMEFSVQRISDKYLQLMFPSLAAESS